MANPVSPGIGGFLPQIRSRGVRCSVAIGYRTSPNIALHLGDSLRADELAGIAGISPTRLITLFRRDTKLTPREYVLRKKVDGSKRMLQDSGWSITQIAHALGFSTGRYYATVFRRFEGISPGDYHRNVTDGG